MNSGILKIFGILIKVVKSCLVIGAFTKIFTRNHIQIMSQIVSLIEKNVYYTEF